MFSLKKLLGKGQDVLSLATDVADGFLGTQRANAPSQTAGFQTQPRPQETSAPGINMGRSPLNFNVSPVYEDQQPAYSPVMPRNFQLANSVNEMQRGEPEIDNSLQYAPSPYPQNLRRLLRR